MSVVLSGILLLLLIGIMVPVGLGSILSVKKTKPFFSGAITTIDATLVQETIDCSILRQPGMMKKNTFMVPKLTKLVLEFAGAANILDTAADRLDITITPTSQATHPHINDREVLFRHSEYCRLAVGAATGPADIWYLTKEFALNNAIVVTNQIFIQLTLHATAQVCYYRVYYEWVPLDVNEVAAQVFNQGIINS